VTDTPCSTWNTVRSPHAADIAHHLGGDAKMLAVLPRTERDFSIFVLFAVLTFFLFVLATTLICLVAGTGFRVGTQYLD
jgi:hypothetical protein